MMQRTKTSRAVCLSLAALVPTCAGASLEPARAESAAPAHAEARGAARRVGKPCRDTGARLPLSDARALAALLDKARKDGTVRLIVTLKVAFKPEGALAGARAVRRQRRSIEGAQRQLLRRLAGHNIDSIKRFETVPALALAADAAALLCIKSAPQVAGVEEDQVAFPSARD